MKVRGATHGIIQAMLAYLINRKLIEAGSKRSVATEPAVTPRLRADINLRVPDLGVTCAASEPRQQLFPDPILLIEVLSPSNHADTWENVWAYSTIPSVREILVVHSTRVKTELLRRQPDGAWPASPEIIESDAMLRLTSIGLECPLRAVYANTHLVG